MYREGYVTFDGVKCVFIVNESEIRLIPTDKDDIRKLSKHFDDQKFLFQFSDLVDQNCIAYIDRVQTNMGDSISLFPLYVLQLLNDSSISSMEITGQAIDEVFHPAGYYYLKAVNGAKNDVDLIRELENADKWTISVDNNVVEICLQYGGILRHGIASDMMLHPQLVVSFTPTTDVYFIFKVYSIIMRFLQITQYNRNFGACKVKLRGGEPEYNSGYLFDWRNIGKTRSFYNQVEYRYLKPYIGKLLQFSAENIGVSYEFLPDATYRWNRTDYTPSLLVSLFSAFESEYVASVSIYETEPYEDLTPIKEKIIQRIQDCFSDELSETERKFIDQAKNSVKNTGNKVGQTKKIKNVLQVLNPALMSSAKHLFIREKMGTENGFSSDNVNKIAKKVVALRGRVSHEYTLLEFDDIQTEYVRFLEIIVYCMMLKRAGIDDDGIELIIGIVFNCNSVRTEKMLINR